MLEFIDNIIRDPSRQTPYFRVADDHVLDANFPPAPIQPNRSYFEVRVCEMYLRDKRAYWVRYNPLVIAVSDFLYGRERQSVPFFVGDQILPSIKPYLKGQYVDFRNTRIAGPIPYSGDDVGLFVGLFRLKVSDLSEKLFGVLETVVKAFDVTSLSRYLDVAKPLSRGLSDLLGMKDVGRRFAARDVFNDREGDSHQFRQGYLVCVNCPEGDLRPETLWVRDGRLSCGESKDRLDHVREYDYCLVRIEHRDRRNDYRALPFYGVWEEVESLLRKRELAKAEWQRIEMLQQLARSPDLTEGHREALIEYFEIRFLKLAGKKPRRGAAAHESTRGAVSNSLVRAAAAAHEAHYPKSVVNKIMDLSKNWADVPELRDDTARRPLDDDAINGHLTAMGKVRKSRSRRPNPQALADAITLAALRER